MGQAVAFAAIKAEGELVQVGLEMLHTYHLWFASPFFPKAIVPDALQRIKRSLKPGGWVVFGFFSLPADPLDHAVAHLKTIRRGGHPWIVEDVEETLRQANFQRIQAFPPTKCGL